MNNGAHRAFRNFNLKNYGGLLENWFEKLVPKIYSSMYNNIFAVGINGRVYMDGRRVGKVDRRGNWTLDWRQLKKTQLYR